MKKLIIIFFVLLCNGALAQSAIADLKFEEVETAFNNSDYKTVLAKLDEFDKLLGSVSSKSLYLRIVSENQLLKEKQTPFSILVSLRKHTSLYLEVMGNENLDDKLREVYKISEELKQYPSDEASWQAQNEEKERTERELALKIDNWDFVEGVKIGDNINNLIRKYNLYTPDNGENKVWYNGNGMVVYPRYEEISTVNGIVTEYKYRIGAFSKPGSENALKDVISALKLNFGAIPINETQDNNYKNYSILSTSSKTAIYIKRSTAWIAGSSSDTYLDFVKTIYKK